MKRREDWPERLVAYLETRRWMPQQWGVNDCAMFCADAIEAMTGIDPAWELRGYTTPVGALKALIKYWMDRGELVPSWQAQPDSLLVETAARIAQIQGFEGIELGVVQRGDVVVLDVSDLVEPDIVQFRRALGIIGMSGKPVTAGTGGTMELTQEYIVRAWRV